MALAAILAGVMWAIGGIDLNAPQPERVALLLMGLGLVAASLRGVAVGLAGCVYAVLIAAAERIAREPLLDGSDVLRATEEAIGVVLRGGDPYTHFMASTVPIGSPFVYPPGEILFYMPAYLLFGDIHRMETLAGIATAAVLAVAGVRVGWGRAALAAMLYATWGIAAFRTVDGGNDVSAALLVTLAIVALAFRGRAALVVSAVALGWALAFKQFAVLVAPLVVRHVAVSGGPWRRYAVVSIGVAGAMTVPFVLMDAGAFVDQQLAALTFHDEIWGLNLAHALAQVGIDLAPYTSVLFGLEIVLAAAALALSLRGPTTLGSTALLAALVLCVPLLLARWTTQSYFVYAATLALVGWTLWDARYQIGTRSPGHAVRVRADAS